MAADHNLHDFFKPNIFKGVSQHIPAAVAEYLKCLIAKALELENDQTPS
jgi:hypothetical protein